VIPGRGRGNDDGVRNDMIRGLRGRRMRGIRDGGDRRGRGHDHDPQRGRPKSSQENIIIARPGDIGTTTVARGAPGAAANPAEMIPQTL
jgi:hypothetical protein